MKQFNLALTCLWLSFVAVDAQKKNLTDDEPILFALDENSTGKPSQTETSTEDIQARASPVVPNKFDRTVIEYEPEIPGIGQERAVVEKTFRDYLPYDSIQNFLVQIIRPETPILDSASDSEKNSISRGNAADTLGDFIVRGTETIARALSAIFEVPRKAIGSLSTGATEALNKIGAYIVGI